MLTILARVAAVAFDVDHAFKLTMTMAAVSVFALFLYFFLSQVVYITYRLAVFGLMILGVAHLVHLNNTHQVVSPANVALLRASAMDVAAWLIPSFAHGTGPVPVPPPPPAPPSAFAALVPDQLRWW